MVWGEQMYAPPRERPKVKKLNIFLQKKNGKSRKRSKTLSLDHRCPRPVIPLRLRRGYAPSTLVTNSYYVPVVTHFKDAIGSDTALSLLRISIRMWREPAPLIGEG
jgi:hypothetical protein